MRPFVPLALCATAAAQLQFGPSSNPVRGQEVKTRNGFIEGIFGTNQGSNINQGNNFNPSGNNFNPGGNNFNQGGSFCCCVPFNDECGDPLGRYIEEIDLVGTGLANPRLQPFKEEATKRTQTSVIPRIVNNPNAGQS